MEIHVKTPHLSAVNAKEYAQEKFARLERFHPALREVEVTFKESGPRMECDVHLVMDHKNTVVICTTAGDLHSAVDLALDRCERQLVRLKEKMRTHKSGRHGPNSDFAPAAAGSDDDEED